MRLAAFALIVAACLQCPLSAEPPAEKVRLPEKVVAAFMKAERFELISVDPRKPPEGQGEFHGWRILGSCVVTDSERDALIAALCAGNKEHDGPGAKCFEPRHGLRCKTDQGNIDIVICFECHHIRIVAADGAKTFFTTSDRPEATFDKVLKSHKIALAPKRE